MSRFLITGGAGSIGSAVGRALAGDGHEVHALDTSEEGLWALRVDSPDIITHLGDILYREDLRALGAGFDGLIHCAAVKHVDLAEENPAIAWRVNVQGTANVLALGIRPTVLVSTDKALGATSVMGRSKAAAEALTASLWHAIVVRLGNVVGSRGSLLPAVLRYRALGRPIPITDPEMTRFFMGASEAVDLIREALAATLPAAWAIVPRQPRSARVLDFLEVSRRMFAPHLPMVTIGARPGERTHEMMERQAGGVLWSNDPEALMSRSEIEHLIGDACRGLPR